MFLLVYFVVEVMLVSLSVHSKTLNWLQDTFNALWEITDRLEYPDAKETVKVSTAVLLQTVGMILRIFNSCSKDLALKGKASSI
jgi:hypothetical protein